MTEMVKTREISLTICVSRCTLTPILTLSGKNRERGEVVRNLLISVCLLSALSWAQSYTGSIRGTVTDHTRAAVPAAKITATDADRNVQFSTVTDSAGRYIFPTLPAARYTLTAQAAGFDKAAQPAFRLEVQQQATVDIELRIGTLSTTIEVESTGALLNTTSAA